MASMVPISRVRSNMAIIIVFALDITTMKKMITPMKTRIPPNISMICLYVGECSCHSLRITLGSEPARRDASSGADGFGVVGVVETHHQLGDAVGLEQALGRGQGHLEEAVVHFLEAAW